MTDYRVEEVYSCSYCMHFERMTEQMEKHLEKEHGIKNPTIILPDEEDSHD